MKKTLTVLMTTAIALGFAQEQTMTFDQLKAHFPVDAQIAQRNDTIYMKVGVNESDVPKNDETLMPGLGIGYRTSFGHHAVDVSVEGNTRQIRNIAQEKVTNYSYTLPKVNYLFVLSPKSNNSLYAGAGLAVGGLKQTTVVAAIDEIINEDLSVTPAVAAFEKNQEFHGLIPNVAVGYEFNRNGAVKTFVQLDVSQPALAVMREGDFLAPKVAISAGIGF